ncbi:ATP-dependent acyl-CoA ligase [Planosporangium thailandense]|uniref:ATP-dependent acyl-CoA ligase n=1 Tax=Planosporangium thailandense TaxID=765197 RepID=A0ABX0Y0J9_9ACTN|nr:AMP-binding protein [Planosporangium thailandense]NJC71848.1 ATP-dependent acyl-CoA ligase [Planosporangium thailandense]
MAGVSASPLPAFAGRDVGWLVDRWAATAPDRTFLTWAPFDAPVRRWTWSEFARDVAALQTGFARRGVRQGDPVALVMSNHPDFLLAWTALTAMGAVAVCLNPRLSADELGYVGSHCGPVGAVVSGEVADVVSGAMPDLAWVAVSEGTGADAVEALLRADPVERRPLVPGAAATSVQYTSGTTARPKGVVWTQANCLWAGKVGATHQGLRPDDTYLIHLPLFHTNALSYSFLSCLWSGTALVLQPKFSASRFWDVSVDHRVTWTSVVSFVLRALADREVPDRHAYRGWGNSANLDPSPVTGGVPVVGWFGMTETVSHPVVGDLHHQDAPGTIGRPAAEYDVRVVDDSGHSVAPGETGNLHVRGVPGVSLFKEYLHDSDATAATYADDGWFVTGDRLRLDMGGTLTFVERDKDVLKVGGENIGAPEIERVLLGVPGVREAAVVGKPDPMLGEVPVAFVVTHDGAEVTVGALAGRCSQMLADFKRPREVRIVDDLPRSTLNKVAKSRLRDLLSAEASGA